MGKVATYGQIAMLCSKPNNFRQVGYGLQDELAGDGIPTFRVVNGKGKAQAVKDCFFGPIRPQAPGSILQLHPDFTLVADEEALSLVKDLL